jgi:hypothetical protein
MDVALRFVENLVLLRAASAQGSLLIAPCLLPVFATHGDSESGADRDFVMKA